MEDTEHVLDGPLGDVHEIALILQMQGMTDVAIRLANAHESIQTWAIETDEKLEAARIALKNSIPSLGRLATEETRQMQGPKAKIAPSTKQRDLLGQVQNTLAQIGTDA